jgi:hypothetical protein
MRSKVRERQHLYVGADLLATTKQFSWVIRDCPFCGCEHWHGGGPIGEDPRHYLFHRVSHCIGVTPEVQGAAQVLNFYDGGYILVDRDPEATKKTIEDVAKARAAGAEGAVRGQR